jgi:hypothetical protein
MSIFRGKNRFHYGSMSVKRLFIVIPLLILSIMLVDIVSASDTVSTSAEQILKKHGLYRENPSSQDYNTAGYRLYLKKEFGDAKSLFYRAVEIDSNHVLAHYNLACVLALEYGQSKEISLLTELFHHLYISISLDSRRRVRALKDHDFDSVSGMEEFYVITKPPEKPDIQKQHQVSFTGTGSVEYDLSVYFIEDDGEKISFKDEKGLFFAKKLYSVKTENDFPVYTTNETKVGNHYTVTTILKMMSNGWSGMYHCVEYVIKVKEK